MNRNGTAETGRLLVVDDNKVNRLLLARSLEQQGHTVVAYGGCR
jgi:CheY-like chemotaxis protein